MSSHPSPGVTDHVKTTAGGTSARATQAARATGASGVRPGRWRAWRWVSGAVLFLVLAAAWTDRYVLPFAIIRPSRMEHWNLYAGRTPASVGLDAEEFWTEAAPDVWLKGWVVRPAGNTPSRGTVVLLHGSSSCKESMLGPAQFLAANGFGSILYDSRACGESGGRWATYGFHERTDFSRVLDAVTRQHGDPGPVGIFGSSYGGSVALQAMAGEPRVAAAIVECAFPDLRETVRDHGRLWLHLPAWVSDLTLDRAGTLAGFDPDAVSPERSARRIAPRPVLLIHGTDDPRIPLAHADRLRVALGASAEWYPVPGGGHEELWHAGGAEYRRRWLGFWERHLAGAATGGNFNPSPAGKAVAKAGMPP